MNNLKPATSNCLTTESSIPISKIEGIHPAISDLYKKLSIPPVCIIPLKSMRKEDLLILLTLHPLRVSNLKNRLYCSGNIRMYQLAQRILSDNDPTPLIQETPLSEAHLAHRALIEYLIAPAYLGYRFADIKILTDVARRAIESGIVKIEDPSIEHWMAKLYGVDSRQLGPKSDSA